jgi:hypothetical protein
MAVGVPNLVAVNRSFVPGTREYSNDRLWKLTGLNSCPVIDDQDKKKTNPTKKATPPTTIKKQPKLELRFLFGAGMPAADSCKMGPVREERMMPDAISVFKSVP